MSATLSKNKPPVAGEQQAPRQIPPRFVTAASLFDGHDAAINIMRRILQSAGVEVIHLAHNRSVAEVVQAALQEDVQGIAVSSYQGGHVEYFKYMVDMLQENNASHIKVFGGGGGVIVPEEIKELHAYGVAGIYSPEDGMQLGLVGMVKEMVELAIATPLPPRDIDALRASGGSSKIPSEHLALAALITAIETGKHASHITNDASLARRRLKQQRNIPVLGITGTGGAGKSSLTDEIIRRFRIDSADSVNIAVLAIDPTRRKTGGALLGDRIRMNSIYAPNIFMRSIATRQFADQHFTDQHFANQHGGEIPACLEEVIAATKQFAFDLIIIETPGIGQGDTGIVPYVDTSVYVMTPEFGAQSQLEKIDMLDFADLVIINKFDRKGAEDAWRDVTKQVQRNREAWDKTPEDMPVFGTIASRFSDDGVSAAYHGLLNILRAGGSGGSSLRHWDSKLPRVKGPLPSERAVIIPPARQRYLAEISALIRTYHDTSNQQCQIARERQQLLGTLRMLKDSDLLDELLSPEIEARTNRLSPGSGKLLETWTDIKATYQSEELLETTKSGEQVSRRLGSKSLSGTWIPRVALPEYEDDGELLKFLLRENLPGYFPFTAGVFPLKRENEDPARMFAGEGDAARTNRRFKALSAHAEAKRLSTAFDSVTLYGFDPAIRPDIYGKVGNSGVSIATLDDMKVLYSGFDLCAPQTSVSMTINGPAPTILAMFLSTAIDQQMDAFVSREARQPNKAEQQQIRAYALSNVRGTVQADILKEDQGQNTCIFSTEFSLRMMGDIQQYFIDYKIKNFYSVSISGYHIAEAGANPISQLAFTLANGFTFVEAYLARGMHIDDFAPHLSFFFSNGMDPEYTVIGRVARRIWALAMRDQYGANERSQRLKYHIQTSGRSLHAQEMQFNDIRTTLQALLAINDNCNSLHTNAYDEAVTTPSEESVRRALAIQLIINHEFGQAKTENPWQGAFILSELTDLVEEAVLVEFERISDRGGVLGAMETGYQRGKIQEDSMLYETLKHDGSLPLIGVNTFQVEAPPQETTIALSRSTEEEKQNQIQRLHDFQARHAEAARDALEQLKASINEGGNGFEALMEAVRYCSLGQITEAFFEVGGQYRRSM